MYMKATVNACDLTDTKYDTPVEGAYILARGATGRVCCVMFVGPEYLAENDITPKSREEATVWADSEPNGYLDA